ncbi:MAG: putative membrane protein [Cyclobacteriaceae bacterium]|jgi:uncharacterized membrane protein
MYSLHMNFLRFLIAATSALCLSLSFAQEHIISYHSDIDIDVDGSMMVTEALRVHAEGVNIQRGIFRDFPTDYRDRLGNHYLVAFDVLGVTRDGISEPWRMERLSNGVRVYIGNENVLLQPGDYSYLIRYRTDRQIGFFDDHDELYWNVTGNGWGFSILSASATVNLPSSVAAVNMSIAAFTGYEGINGQNYTGSVQGGSAAFSTTQTLAPREGLTLVVTWPKGLIPEPTTLQKAGYLLFDNRGLLLMLLALLLSCAYLYKSWSRVGRDPDAAIVFPQYEPPRGYSPASTRYIMNMTYDETAFSAAIINLAVKGYLTIEKTSEEYSLMKTESDVSLAPGEQVLFASLFKKTDKLVLVHDTENILTISKAKRSHSKALENDYNKIYFNLNSALLLPSFIGSLIVFIAVALSGAITVLAGLVFALINILHGVFYFLLRAPSVKGRRLMDKLEGFKLYLEVAEQDDLNLKTPPDKTPELFESYLPYALALGVEQAWAKQFTEIFATLEAKTGKGYHPLWYAGVFHSHNIGAFTTEVGSSFNSAISAATTAPGSTSGGGGFSGGGGGGGGGGGW